MIEDPEVISVSEADDFALIAIGRKVHRFRYCPKCAQELDVRAAYAKAGFDPPNTEWPRLASLTADIRSKEAAIKQFGPPNYVAEVGEGLEADTTVFEYYTVSSWFNVELYFGGWGVETRITPKRLEDCRASKQKEPGT